MEGGSVSTQKELQVCSGGETCTQRLDEVHGNTGERAVNAGREGDLTRG